MKKISKKSNDFIKMFLTMEDMNYISITKHDLKILYNSYKKTIIKDLDLLTLADMLRTLDLEKNTKEDIKSVLNLIAEKIEEIIDKEEK